MRLLALLLVVGCTPGDEAVVGNRVTVIDADVGVEPDRLTVARAGNEALLDQQPGDILVSGRGVGFLRKVVSVDGRGDPIVIATEPAALTDALEQAAYDGTLEDGKWDWSGPSFNGFFVGFDGLEVQSGVDAQLTMTRGSVDFHPTLDLGMKMRWGRVTAFDLVATGRLTAELGFRLHTEGPAEVRYRKELWKSAPMVYYQQIGYVPVVEVVRVVVSLDVSGSTRGETTIDVGASARSDVAVGARYAEGTWRPVGEHSLTLDTEGPTITTTNDVELQVTLPVEVQVSFYDLAGPYLSLEPYLRASYSAAEGATASWGLAGVFGGSVNLLGAGDDSRLLGFEGNLFDFNCEFGTPVEECLSIPSSL